MQSILLQGEIGQAITAYKGLIHFKPELATAYVDLGLAYGMSGQLDRATDQFKTALNFDSNLLEAHYALGVSYRHQGRLDKVIESLKKVIDKKNRFHGSALRFWIRLSGSRQADGSD